MIDLHNMELSELLEKYQGYMHYIERDIKAEEWMKASTYAKMQDIRGELQERFSNWKNYPEIEMESALTYLANYCELNKIDFVLTAAEFLHTNNCNIYDFIDAKTKELNERDL